MVITKGQRNIIEQLGGKPALDVVKEMIDSLPSADKELLSHGLLIGRAINEYRDNFGRGDFLVRMDVPYLYFHHTLTALAFGLITLGAVGGGRLATRLLANRPITFLGVISYSLYLWHYPLLSAVQGAGWLDGRPAPAWIVVLLAAVPLVLLVSWLSYRWIERPFLAPAAPAPENAGAK